MKHTNSKAEIALLESPHKIDDGNLIGRHPDSLSEADFAELGHVKRPLIRVIRDKCSDCCGGDANEVDKCVSYDCALWAYRKGRNPQAFKREVTQEQREIAAERFRKLRETA